MIQEGRVIRRLVSLTDPVINLIREHDRRILLAAHIDEIEEVNSNDK